MKFYIVVDPNGNFVCKDKSTGPYSSGGYPYEIKEFNPHQVEWFLSVEKALEYSSMFKDRDYKVYSAEIQFGMVRQ